MSVIGGEAGCLKNLPHWRSFDCGRLEKLFFAQPHYARPKNVGRFSEKKSPRPLRSRAFLEESGDVLLSHMVPHAVPSAQRSLTSVFGMGTGGTFPLWPPKNQVALQRSRSSGLRTQKTGGARKHFPVKNMKKNDNRREECSVAVFIKNRATNAFRRSPPCI